VLNNRKEIFHIAFSKRRKVPSCRFSIPGLPALYLGTSIYICWEEIERPLLDDVYAAKFQFVSDQTFNFLNLWITPHVIQGLFPENLKEVLDDSILSQVFIKTFKSMTILWPLIAACHVRVFQTEENFKPEYIIPQLVTQYVSEENRYDGIIYFSTKDTDSGVLAKDCRNIVLPAKANSSDEEFSQNLVKKVYCTEPIPVRLFVANGIGENYSTTEFERIETELSKMSMNAIDPQGRS
jgi:hypothetical protein